MYSYLSLQENLALLSRVSGAFTDNKFSVTEFSEKKISDSKFSEANFTDTKFANKQIFRNHIFLQQIFRDIFSDNKNYNQLIIEANLT